jgi:NAD(P)-dependent dehydrogenase (short-subunit alcohol dehydrogenase family)
MQQSNRWEKITSQPFKLMSLICEISIGYIPVKEQKSSIDILFANAGVSELAPLGAITEAHFEKAFGINVKGVLFTVQKALPLLSDRASIVINASVASLKGMQAMSVYAATKAALRSFVRSWSVDLKNRKIRVNVVSPGMVITPIFKNALGQAMSRLSR